MGLFCPGTIEADDRPMVLQGQCLIVLILFANFETKQITFNLWQEELSEIKLFILITFVLYWTELALTP